MKRYGNLVPVAGIALLLMAVPMTLFAIEINTDEAAGHMDRRIDDDYLFTGETLGFSGSSDSLFFFGKNLSMTGENRGNLVAAGRTITVDGSIADDSILAGRSISLSGRLGGTTFTAGETVTLLPGATVDGALFIGAGTAGVAGDVAGDLYVGARSLVIAGTVDGDVHVGAGEIELTESAVIRGDLTYDSEDELSEAEHDRVRGTVSREDFAATGEWKEHDWSGPAKWVISVVICLSILAFTLLLFLFPGTRGQDTDRGHSRFWKTVAWGLIPFFGYPIAISSMFIAGIAFGITIPIGLALIGSMGLIGYVLYALALPQIGAYLSRVFGWRLHEREGGAVFMKTLLGFVPVLVFGLIPFLNGLAFVVTVSLGWGIAIEKLFGVRFGSEQA